MEPRSAQSTTPLSSSSSLPRMPPDASAPTQEFRRLLHAMGPGSNAFFDEDIMAEHVLPQRELRAILGCVHIPAFLEACFGGSRVLQVPWDEDAVVDEGAAGSPSRRATRMFMLRALGIEQGATVADVADVYSSPLKPVPCACCGEDCALDVRAPEASAWALQGMLLQPVTRLPGSAAPPSWDAVTALYAEAARLVAPLNTQYAAALADMPGRWCQFLRDKASAAEQEQGPSKEQEIHEQEREKQEEEEGKGNTEARKTMGEDQREEMADRAWEARWAVAACRVAATVTEEQWEGKHDTFLEEKEYRVRQQAAYVLPEDVAGTEAAAAARSAQEDKLYQEFRALRATLTVAQKKLARRLFRAREDYRAAWREAYQQAVAACECGNESRVVPAASAGSADDSVALDPEDAADCKQDVADACADADAQGVRGDAACESREVLPPGARPSDPLLHPRWACGVMDTGSVCTWDRVYQLCALITYVVVHGSLPPQWDVDGFLSNRRAFSAWPGAAHAPEMLAFHAPWRFVRSPVVTPSHGHKSAAPPTGLVCNACVARWRKAKCICKCTRSDYRIFPDLALGLGVNRIRPAAMTFFEGVGSWLAPERLQPLELSDMALAFAQLLRQHLDTLVEAVTGFLQRHGTWYAVPTYPWLDWHAWLQSVRPHVSLAYRTCPWDLVPNRETRPSGFHTSFEALALLAAAHEYDAGEGTACRASAVGMSGAGASVESAETVAIAVGTAEEVAAQGATQGDAQGGVFPSTLVEHRELPAAIRHAPLAPHLPHDTFWTCGLLARDTRGEAWATALVRIFQPCASREEGTPRRHAAEEEASEQAPQQGTQEQAWRLQKALRCFVAACRSMVADARRRLLPALQSGMVELAPCGCTLLLPGKVQGTEALRMNAAPLPSGTPRDDGNDPCPEPKPSRGHALRRQMEQAAARVEAVLALETTEKAAAVAAFNTQHPYKPLPEDWHTWSCMPDEERFERYWAREYWTVARRRELCAAFSMSRHATQRLLELPTQDFLPCLMAAVCVDSLHFAFPWLARAGLRHEEGEWKDAILHWTRMAALQGLEHLVSDVASHSANDEGKSESDNEGMGTEAETRVRCIRHLVSCGDPVHTQQAFWRALGAPGGWFRSLASMPAPWKRTLQPEQLGWTPLALMKSGMPQGPVAAAALHKTDLLGTCTCGYCGKVLPSLSPACREFNEPTLDNVVTSRVDPRTGRIVRVPYVDGGGRLDEEAARLRGDAAFLPDTCGLCDPCLSAMLMAGHAVLTSHEERTADEEEHGARGSLHGPTCFPRDEFVVGPRGKDGAPTIMTLPPPGRVTPCDETASLDWTTYCTERGEHDPPQPEAAVQELIAAWRDPRKQPWRTAGRRGNPEHGWVHSRDVHAMAYFARHPCRLLSREEMACVAWHTARMEKMVSALDGAGVGVRGTARPWTAPTEEGSPLPPDATILTACRAHGDTWTTFALYRILGWSAVLEWFLRRSIVL